MKANHFQYNNEIDNTTDQTNQHHKVIPITENQQTIQPVVYPSLNINNYSVQQEPIVHNQYLDQYKQYTHFNETVNPPLATPFINNVDTNFQNDEIITLEDRKELILKINLCFLLQHTIQIFFCTIVQVSIGYAKLYFNYEEIKYRISFYLISTFLLIFLLCIRFFRKVHRQRKYQIWIYFLYILLYASFSSGITASGQLTQHVGVGYLITSLIYYFGSIGILIILIQFQFLIKMLDDSQLVLKSFMKAIMSGPLSILFIISALFGIDAATVTLVFELIYAAFFSLFYVPSLLQIYRGKFSLRKNQYYIGTILTTANMFLLFIP